MFLAKPLQTSDIERRICGSSGRVLIACDFDGALAPTASHPDLARLPEHTEQALRELIATDRVVLTVISGRSLSDLRQRVQMSCVLAANHGLEISGPGFDYEHPVAAERATVIAQAAEALAPCIARHPEAWIENKRLTATLHFRDVPPSQRYQLLWSARQALRAFGTSIGMRSGKCSLELHPRVDWRKGNALRRIRETFGLNDAPCLIFGDDSNDETLFREFTGDVTVFVGSPRPTAAAYFLPDPCAVLQILEQTRDLLSTDASPLARAAG